MVGGKGIGRTKKKKFAASSSVAEEAPHQPSRDPPPPPPALIDHLALSSQRRANRPTCQPHMASRKRRIGFGSSSLGLGFRRKGKERKGKERKGKERKRMKSIVKQEESNGRAR
ncbi:hypothetical protein H6P81_003093 [Aristolochia fimbriata]|uniref:Uncharacterized protein n=1 Tax=Aristolochia fimbriata TaxID=158543 RepID=A0AAV7FBK8_ARIFI|nr:hypothetical protein H6P81_003093 [Aristolochia fimbriata]